MVMQRTSVVRSRTVSAERGGLGARCKDERLGQALYAEGREGAQAWRRVSA